MKKLTSLTICCSLLLAGAALAQPEEQASPKPGAAEQDKGHAKPEKPPEGRNAHAMPPQNPNENKPGGENTKKHGAENTPATPKEMPAASAPKPVATPRIKENAKTAPNKKMENETAKTKSETEPAPAATAAESVKASASAAPEPTKKDMKKNGKDHAKAGATPMATATPMGTPLKSNAGAKVTPAPTASVTPMGTPVPSASMTPAASASVSAGTSTTATSATTDTTATNATAKQPAPQQITKIKEQHANFRAEPRPEQVPSVTFSANYRLQGSDTWQGPQYEVYRSYRPERHDQSYYRSHYSRVELVSGGYYYENNGYWYPAWGYDTAHQYYAYDTPIYVGHRSVPPDRIIADVQAALKDMGYYRGEVDGLLGPLTREALTGYQSRQGLQVTAVIDEPTLTNLDLG
ncbi:MAG: peptidoglycan-binding protein [Chthoniobacterales bacterium]